MGEVMLYADSRGRGLKVGETQVVVMPGKGLREIQARMLADLEQMEEKPRMIYVMAGIIDVVNRTNKGEVIFAGNVGGIVAEVEQRLVSIMTEVKACAVVFCTVAPMDIKRWNGMRRDQGKIRQLRYERSYQEMQSEINEAVRELNRRITAMNRLRAWKTPFLHSEVLHNKKNKRVRVEFWHLMDGIHPGVRLMGKWEKMLLKTIGSNLERYGVKEESMRIKGLTDSEEEGEKRFDRAVLERNN